MRKKKKIKFIKHKGIGSHERANTLACKIKISNDKFKLTCNKVLPGEISFKSNGIKGIDNILFLGKLKWTMKNKKKKK